ncbi:MAG: acyltransferase [Alphaproteobacteria bacterium]
MTAQTRAQPAVPDAFMPAQGGYIRSLNGLRTLSIAIVLGNHFVDGRVPGGLGVYIFFVISGFLIARLLFAEMKATSQISLPRFYLRRALRLYPIVIAYCLALVIFAMAFGIAFRWSDPLSALFYYANYHYTSGVTETLPLSHFWSLSIEEHFYFILPVLMIMLRCKPSLVLVAAGVAFVACLACRIIVAMRHPEYLSTEIFYFQTQFRLDSLAFGVAIAAGCESQTGRDILKRLGHPALLALALVTIAFCLVYRDPFFRHTLRYTILGGAISLVLCFVLFRASIATTLLNLPFMVWLGRLSYSLYVWHLAVPPTIGCFFPDTHGPAATALKFALSLMLAIVSYYGLELPIMRLRARIASPASRRLVTAAAD